MSRTNRPVPIPPGTRCGALVVLHREGNLRRYIAYRCKCDCGTEVVLAGSDLRRGTVKACNINGHRFGQVLPGTKASLLPEYEAWRGMLKRCRNQDHQQFPNYGGRGITVCERWNSFADFYVDMKSRPTPAHTLERKDVNGNYEPGNCKWATQQEQQRNKRDTIRVTYEGKRMALADVIDQIGLSRVVVMGRLKLGWPLDVALALPKSSSYRKRGRPRKTT